MISTQALAALDAAVHSAAADPELVAARERAGIRDWPSGGCAVFAAGIATWLGPETVIVGLREQGDPQIEHLAAVWCGLYCDAYGVRDESDFLFDAETVGLFRIPELISVADPAAVTHVPFAPELVPVVTAALRSRLDPGPSLTVLRALSRG